MKDIESIIFSKTTSKNIKILNRLLKKCNHNLFFIFKIQPEKMPESYFGMYSARGYEILKGDNCCDSQKFIPLKIERIDKNFLLPRGGASKSLKNKKILVIGCGSVGGYLCENLAQSGILNITIIDKEKLKSENFFRHILGKKHRDEFKTDALKKELEERLPFISVNSIPRRIEDVLKDKKFDFKEYSLVVVALGDPNVELLLNEYLWGEKGSPPSIYCWLDPYGAGGHAVFCNNRKSGCFECLYTPSSPEPEEPYNRASFVEPDQSFVKTLSGCGGAFTPYGALDAKQTSLLASRLALSYLGEDIDSNELLSWKGSDAEILKNGFLMSKRYNLTQDELFQNRIQFINMKCQICDNEK